ncbi:acetoacetate-CoA ligase [Cladophialophora immunda]|uniref:Acetoacetate-CoA ligase n=1 Tax=Cladophialophora immunda TaxID=569365 RepID=A0A0D1ZQB0_9EURO|nr:acetoacetate-CoA ligase [Cladophialophora immunda]KIW30206.1 acetoacetate-CoA ligase [Cladophialophora immunda]
MDDAGDGDANPVIWVPSKSDLTDSSLAKFRDLVNQRYNLSLQSYKDIHNWSVNASTSQDFWMSVFEFLDIGATKLPSRVFSNISDTGTPSMFPSPIFFPDAQLNFAGSIFKHCHRDPSAIAIIETTEGSLDHRSVTWGELFTQVETLSTAMRRGGVKRGDRVAAVISASRLAIALCLATLSIGAIWSSISPDFGSKGILDRIVQIDPKLIFTDTTVLYNGKRRDLSGTILEWAPVAARGLSLDRIVLCGRGGSTSTSSPDLTTQIPKTLDLRDFYTKGEGGKMEFEQMPFSAPAFIFYSSGTTGVPKCILHSAGGVLLQVKKDYVLHIGVLPKDILFQYTTTAWIMWAFLLTAMSIGTTIVVHEGSPVYPDPPFLLKIISKIKVSIFGTSAKYLTDLMDSNVRPRDVLDLSALRKVTSTGSVLPSDVAKWFYNHGFPPKVQLISGSGGTDCSCSFVGGNALTPVRANEISDKALGMAVDIFDPTSVRGQSLEGTDESGELVCRAPFPSQPLTFWGPDGLEKYKDAYFSMFGPDTWVQGDLIRINPRTRGIQMLGRSDGVLNPSGVRFGSSEIYNVVRLFPEVEDSVCTGQRRSTDRDEVVILFLKLKPGVERTAALRTQIKAKIGQSLSKRHVPKYVFYVDDIPYSNVGKKLEILVKKIISGHKAESTVVANPESLPLYQKYYDIERAAQEEDAMLLSRL